MIRCIRSIVHTGNIPPVKWINKTKKTQKGSGLENLSVYCKMQSARQHLKKTWYHRTFNAVILLVTLCWKHDLNNVLDFNVKRYITQNTQIQKCQMWHQTPKSYHILILFGTAKHILIYFDLPFISVTVIRCCNRNLPQ